MVIRWYLQFLICICKWHAVLANTNIILTIRMKNVLRWHWSPQKVNRIQKGFHTFKQLTSHRNKSFKLTSYLEAHFVVRKMKHHVWTIFELIMIIAKNLWFPHQWRGSQNCEVHLRILCPQKVQHLIGQSSPQV